MKIAIIALLVIQSLAQLLAQESLIIERQVVAPAGGFFQATDNSFSISWTMGEAIIETLQGETLILTQGFQQPDMDLDTTVQVTEIPVEILGLHVFPNPAAMVVTIRANKAELLPLGLQVFDLNGREVIRRQLTDEMYSLDVGSLANGIYVLRFTTRQHRFSSPVKLQKISNR